MKEPLMTIAQVAEQLGLHVKTVSIMARRGDIAGYRVGPGKHAPYRFSQEQVDRYLSKRMTVRP